uniref:Receptor-like serine/threonine-protein kinase n=1 Tax=Salix viminalis TaxID=40686 RepID=A0A6N2MWA7_SALVM
MEARSSMGIVAVILVYSFFFSTLKISTAVDSINTTQSIRDGETLVSTSGSFELGFFSPVDSTSRYLGLWYKKSPRTVVWVANRGIPISNNSGTLKVTSQGNLVLLNGTNNPVWSSNTSTTAQNPVAKLLESGNLVVRDVNGNKADNFLWQSFDYPCDTLLPGMELGSKLVTGNRFLSSWKGTENPAPGQFTLGVDLGYPQIVFREGTRILYRLGSWNGQFYTGFPELKPNPIYTFEFVLNQNEVYFKFEPQNSSVFQGLTVHPSGFVQLFTWSDQTNDWKVFSTAPVDQCENYALCGANARCDINSSPPCACLDGFIPKSPSEWNSRNWTGGCIPRTPFKCTDKDGFQSYTGVKLPDTSSSWYENSFSLVECEGLCIQNCSCFAYANIDIIGRGSGCWRWFGDLIDTRKLPLGGQDIYLRLAASEPGVRAEKRRKKKTHAGVIGGAAILGSSILILGIVFCVRRRKQRKNDNFEDNKEEDMELPMFDLTTIEQATYNFSSGKKLGEGGFGVVYKGTLIEGKEIAVKRLSKSSRQGLNEFKNEVLLTAKLQHRNLVKLLGCCVHEDEKMLIYEYMPKRSLDSFIFGMNVFIIFIRFHLVIGLTCMSNWPDTTRSKFLDWSKRTHIIDGIARGLLYLHQDSRLRIIHRDIKASNILLDNELNPKISDFGLARMFGGDQTEANTKRVVGTYGYMSPEYALDGHFSVKSDVFSFGVLVLEIVSGKKNRGFCCPDYSQNLLGHAWVLWCNGIPLELIDKCLADLYTPSEALRCLHVALLCVQQRPEDRPNMSSVVLMLGSENSLPQPKQPGFLMGSNPAEKDTSPNKHQSYTANEVTVTELHAR